MSDATKESGGTGPSHRGVEIRVAAWVRFGVYVVLDRLRIPISGCPLVSMTILFMPILRNCDPNKFTLK